MEEIRWEVWGRESGDKVSVCLMSFTDEQSAKDAAKQLTARGVQDVEIREVKS